MAPSNSQAHVSAKVIRKETPSGKRLLPGLHSLLTPTIVTLYKQKTHLCKASFDKVCEFMLCQDTLLQSRRMEREVSDDSAILARYKG